MGLFVSDSKYLPQLIRMPNVEVPVEGTVYLDIYIGVDRVIRHRVAVVGDKYLSTDILLGADVLSWASVFWEDDPKIFKWGDFTYAVRHAVGLQ